MYRPAPVRRLAVTVALAFMAVVASLEAVHYLNFFDFLARAERGAIVPGEGATFDSTTVTLARLLLLGDVITVVSWLAWLHRAVANSGALGRPLDTSPAGAVGWWFVPFANLVKPYRIVRDLYENSVRAEGQRWAGTALVAWWWASYLAAGLILNFANSLFFTAKSTDATQLRVWAGGSSLGQVAFAAAAVLALIIVRRVETGQAQRSQSGPVEGGSPLRQPPPVLDLRDDAPGSSPRGSAVQGAGEDR